ncbi:hypothetical protein ACWS7L_06675 [Exiguobacterium artemiae]
MSKTGERLLRIWIRVPRFIKRMIPLSITLYVIGMIITNGVDTLWHFDFALVKGSDLVISLVGASILVLALSRSKGEDAT